LSSSWAKKDLKSKTPAGCGWDLRGPMEEKDIGTAKSPRVVASLRLDDGEKCWLSSVQVWPRNLAMHVTWRDQEHQIKEDPTVWRTADCCTWWVGWLQVIPFRIEGVLYGACSFLFCKLQAIRMKNVQYQNGHRRSKRQ
jgi:hypothetical protein